MRTWLKFGTLIWREFSGQHHRLDESPTARFDWKWSVNRVTTITFTWQLRKPWRVTPRRAEDASPAARRQCRAAWSANPRGDDWCAPWDCARTWSWRRSAGSWRTVPCRIRITNDASGCRRSYSSYRIWNSYDGGHDDVSDRYRCHHCCWRSDDCCCGWTHAAMGNAAVDDVAASRVRAHHSTTTSRSSRCSHSSNRAADHRRSSQGQWRKLQKTEADGSTEWLVLRSSGWPHAVLLLGGQRA